MTTAPLVAAPYYGSDTRVPIALALFVVFVALLPRPAPRPLAGAVLTALVIPWDFGATLIWGTSEPSKERGSFVLTPAGNWLLLCCAIIGILTAAAALRAFANGRRRLGTSLAVTFAVTFSLWSLAVRYWPVIAVAGLLAGIAALSWASVAPSREERAAPVPQLDAPASGWIIGGRLVRIALPMASGFLFYACLRWGPKTWADPQCGATLLLPGLAGALGLSALGAGLSARLQGKRAEAVIAAVVIAVIAAGVVCSVAFLTWFGQNMCGE